MHKIFWTDACCQQLYVCTVHDSLPPVWCVCYVCVCVVLFIQLRWSDACVACSSVSVCSFLFSYAYLLFCFVRLFCNCCHAQNQSCHHRPTTNARDWGSLRWIASATEILVRTKVWLRVVLILDIDEIVILEKKWITWWRYAVLINWLLCVCVSIDLEILQKQRRRLLRIARHCSVCLLLLNDLDMNFIRHYLSNGL